VSDIIVFGAAIAGDFLSAFQLPGGNTLVSVAEGFLAKRRREAANVLIDEIQNGYHGPINFEEHDVDPLIDIILRFSKAVADGAAKENLRLLAQIIAGLKKNKALEADRFRRWCGVVEHLTRDELVVIGMAYRAKKAITAAGLNAPNDFWQRLQAALKEGGYAANEIPPLCASVSRTGVLVPLGALSSVAYVASPWLVELGELADLESLKEKKKDL
jgi:hypothetical protein